MPERPLRVHVVGRRPAKPDPRQSDWISMLDDGLLTPLMPLAIALVSEAVEPEDIDPPIVHRMISAAGQPPPATRAPRSIFDLYALTAAQVISEEHEPADETPLQLARPLVTRDVGVTRCAGSAYPANRWTPEREEQERQRRAKQRPPRPTKQQFKMKGTKVWAET